MNEQTGSYAAIDAYIERQMRRLNLPGAALAIVEGDRIVHTRGFGRAWPGGGPPTPQTPFFIGSLTKSFTALAVMQLVEAGQIELDAPARRYLPWFRVADRAASERITVRHLLHQTSGLPTGPGWEQLAADDDWSEAGERHARLLASVKLNHPPGAAFQYSNLNYNLLGLIIEQVSGQPYPERIAECLFAPLRMRHSHTARAAAQRDGMAAGNRSWFGAPIPAQGLPEPLGSLPAGQLLSSVEDMGHYLIAHLNGGRYEGAQVLSADGIAQMQRGAVDAGMFGLKQAYGMGWYDETHDGARLAWHSGMVPESYAYMALLPDLNRGIVLLINVNHFIMELTLSEVCAGAAALLADRPAPRIKLGAIPWAQRGMILIPFLQLATAAATLRRSRDRPRPARLLPVLIVDLLPVAAALALLRSRLFGFLRLFAPDAVLVVLISGLIGAVSAVARPAFLRARSRRG